MDGARRNHASKSKPERKKEIPDGFTYVWDTGITNEKTRKDYQTDNRSKANSKGGREGEYRRGMNTRDQDNGVYDGGGTLGYTMMQYIYM